VTWQRNGRRRTPRGRERLAKAVRLIGDVRGRRMGGVENFDNRSQNVKQCTKGVRG